MPLRVDKLNNIWARIVWLGKSENEPSYANPLALLDGYFAIYTPNFQFDPRFKNRKITRYDGKFHLFRKDLGALPMGLIPEAVKLFKDNQFEVHVNDDVKSCFKNELYNEENVNNFLVKAKEMVGFDAHDYQKEALHLATKKKRVLFESPTGSGKSYTIYLILRYIRFLLKKNEGIKALIVVPNKVLITQLFRDYLNDYKWKNVEDHIGLISSDFTSSEKKISLTKEIIISTCDSVDNLLKKDKTFCEQFNVVFLDEAHKAKDPKESKRLTKILNSCTNAEYRIALTGTIPKNKLFEKSLEGCFGKKIVLTETSTLQENGVLSDCEIFETIIPYSLESKKFLKKNKVKYQEEVELVRLNNSKLYSISYLIDNEYIKTNENTLILCNKIENGELEDIVSHIKEHHKDFEVEIIHGGIKGEERDRIITSIDNREGVIVVATYATMSTGVNIKKLHNCIFASSLKSYETIIQSVGRLLRKHSSKEYAKIFDLVDDLQVQLKSGNYWRSYVNTHWKVRETYYQEKKFKMNQITIDKTFDLNI